MLVQFHVTTHQKIITNAWFSMKNQYYTSCKSNTTLKFYSRDCRLHTFINRRLIPLLDAILLYAMFYLSQCVCFQPSLVTLHQIVQRVFCICKSTSSGIVHVKVKASTKKLIQIVLTRLERCEQVSISECRRREQSFVNWKCIHEFVGQDAMLSPFQSVYNQIGLE